jgi:ketosteroid isomerase-like protein
MNEDDVRLLSANEAFYDAFAARDLAGMDALWSRERPVTCIHPGWNALSGRDAVMASWRAIFRSDDVHIEATDARTHLLGDAAYVICFEGSPGAAPVLVATNVFVREDGGWSLVHHQAGQLARSPAPAASKPAN